MDASVRTSTCMPSHRYVATIVRESYVMRLSFLCCRQFWPRIVQGKLSSTL
jgi:hypothetical protein